MSLHLASLFQDHAVLQRDQLIPVWGWATPLSRIRITLGEHVACGLSNQLGDFLVRLPALPAGGPHTLRVELPETGEELIRRDVLVGEVWLASGQSNMEWTLAQCAPGLDEAIAAADFPDLRVFTVERRAHLGPQRTVAGAWQAITPTNAGSCTAVGFCFARRLHRELGVPVGLISSAWGGSLIQAWTSRSTLAFNPEAAPRLADYEAMAWTPERWQLAHEVGLDGRISKFPSDPGNTALAKGWAHPAFDDAGWDPLNLPSTWQAAGHPGSGVYWFRRTIEIPEAWLGRALELHLGAIDKQDITYVNGVEIARSGKDREEQFWNVPRVYLVPAELVTTRRLTFAVRVFSFVYNGGMTGPEENMHLHPAGQPETSLPLAGAWRYRCEHDLGVVTDHHVLGHAEPESPHMLFDNMIQPLIPYALRGAIWYQGESNAGEAGPYHRLQRDLIEDWRRHWGKPDLAFHLVQLPRYQTPVAFQADSTWARLREAQAAALDLPHVGMAVTIDLGDANDIHPKNKLPVGERLAQSALAHTYGRPLLPCGPVARTFTVAGNTLRVGFTHAEGGLITTDGAAPRLFYLAGDDRTFQPAQARIDGNTMVVTSPEIAHPTAVRYAWADYPAGANLANLANLPASPFRSDRW